MGIILVIDTNTSRFKLITSDPWVLLNPEQSLVRQIKKEMQDKGKSIKDIKMVAVIQGKGAFSKTRNAVVLANILSLIAKIPVISFETEDLFNQYKDNHSEIKGISPKYYAEPNIG